MATLLPTLFPRFFTTNGQPLAGGKLFSFQAGTTTPLATFTDAAGTVANANPVILNSSGRANVWMGPGSYKFVLQDANGVQQDTVDNVSASTSGSGGSTVMPFGQATNIASANLVDLGSITTNFANIQGINSISNFGNTASLTNPVYLIKFDSSLTLVNNANLLLPGGNNITVGAGDHAYVEFLGSGVWRLFSYGVNSYTTGFGRQTDVASNSSVDLGGVKSHNANITGTTTINDFGANGSLDAPFYLVRFDGALTLTHNATSMILPFGTNIVTAANDQAMVKWLGGNNWRVIQYWRAVSSPYLPADQIALVARTAGRAITADQNTRVLLATATASASTVIAFDSTLITNAWRRYEIELLDIIPGADAVSLQLLLSTDNNATNLTAYRITADVSTSNGSGFSNSFNASFAYIPVSGIAAGNFVSSGANRSYNGKLILMNPRGTSLNKVKITGTYDTDAGYLGSIRSDAGTNVNTAINAVTIKTSSGTISGTAYLYGVV